MRKRCWISFIFKKMSSQCVTIIADLYSHVQNQTWSFDTFLAKVRDGVVTDYLSIEENFLDKICVAVPDIRLSHALKIESILCGIPLDTTATVPVIKNVVFYHLPLSDYDICLSCYDKAPIGRRKTLVPIYEALDRGRQYANHTRDAFLDAIVCDECNKNMNGKRSRMDSESGEYEPRPRPEKLDAPSGTRMMFATSCPPPSQVSERQWVPTLITLMCASTSGARQTPLSMTNIQSQTSGNRVMPQTKSSGAK